MHFVTGIGDAGSLADSNLDIVRWITEYLPEKSLTTRSQGVNTVWQVPGFMHDCSNRRLPSLAGTRQEEE